MIIEQKIDQNKAWRLGFFKIQRQDGSYDSVAFFFQDPFENPTIIELSHESVIGLLQSLKMAIGGDDESTV